MKKSNKNIGLIGGILCFILGIGGLYKGFNSEEQWRQSFSIIGFIFLMAIFIFSLYIYFRKL